MAGEPNQPTDYRARPISETQGIVERVQTLQPEQRVVVNVKNWKQSATVIINGILFVAAGLISILDILFGANVIEPLVKVFTSDPEAVTRIITIITQVYTALNIYLRVKTTQPITLRTDPK